ncbi:hypothetical protein BAL199_20755 [alpha proteobacterium BAL199]|jgi:hypothetical protein|nr:hypothetical protein BAL199_20755 [alpha proteobacterium BAL199]
MTKQWLGLRGGLLALAVVLGIGIVSAPVFELRAEEKSTTQRKDAEKSQKKKDKEFNREILYRHAVGPKVLALGPFSISLFVQGQPLEARIRVAVQTTTELARTQLEPQKNVMNGIVYPLAVRLFEQGRPTTEQIRAFKEDTRVKLLERYPSMIDDVFIESMI